MSIKNYIKSAFVVFSLQLSTPTTVLSNTLLIDKIVATVGDRIILLSEVESYYSQLTTQDPNGEISKKDILDRLIESKLLVNSAESEKIAISDDKLVFELNSKINYFIEVLGSVDSVELYFKKPLHNIKSELMNRIKEQAYAQEMSAKIMSNIESTPEEVILFFNSLPQEEIPFCSDEFIVWQIVMSPLPSNSEAKRIRGILLDCKSKVEEGCNFEKLAYKISQRDDIANFQYGSRSFILGNETPLDYESEILASQVSCFEVGQVSPIITADSSLFLARVVTKESNKITVEYLAVYYDKSNAYIEESRKLLLNIKNDIESQKLSFEDAASAHYSVFPDHSNASEIPFTNGDNYELTDLPIDIIYAIEDNKVAVGSISEPIISKDKYNRLKVKLIYFKKKIPAHVATLKQNYEKIDQLYLNIKRQQKLQEWINKTKLTTDIWVDKSYDI